MFGSILAIGKVWLYSICPSTYCLYEFADALLKIIELNAVFKNTPDVIKLATQNLTSSPANNSTEFNAILKV